MLFERCIIGCGRVIVAHSAVQYRPFISAIIILAERSELVTRNLLFRFHFRVTTHSDSRFQKVSRDMFQLSINSACFSEINFSKNRENSLKLSNFKVLVENIMSMVFEYPYSKKFQHIFVIYSFTFSIRKSALLTSFLREDGIYFPHVFVWESRKGRD